MTTVKTAPKWRLWPLVPKAVFFVVALGAFFALWNDLVGKVAGLLLFTGAIAAMIIVEI